MRKKLKKTFVTIIGFIVLITGVILIPYPGPGWLIVFIGLGILSTEYEWAKRLLGYGKRKYDDWNKWVQKQNPYVQLALSLLTLAVTVLTLWLLNGYGILNHSLNLGQDWLDSPLPIFH